MGGGAVGSTGGMGTAIDTKVMGWVTMETSDTSLSSNEPTPHQRSCQHAPSQTWCIRLTVPLYDTDTLLLNWHNYIDIDRQIYSISIYISIDIYIYIDRYTTEMLYWICNQHFPLSENIHVASPNYCEKNQHPKVKCRFSWRKTKHLTIGSSPGWASPLVVVPASCCQGFRNGALE